MKIILRLIVACVALFLSGCHKSQSGHAYSATETNKFQSIALASIAAKYPELKSSELKFEGLGSVTNDSGARAIEVRYILPSTAERKEENTQQVQKSSITTKAYRVIMSSSGDVQTVSDGAMEAVHIVTK
jgi:outer membrane lipoprotein SlyB